MPRLYWRIYLHFLGVLLVVGLAATIVVAIGQRRAFQRQVTERVTRHVSALVAEVAGDQAALARRLAQLHDDLGLDVTVRDPEGRLLAAAGSELWSLGPGELAELRAGRVLAPRGPPWDAAAAVRAPGGDALLAFVQLSAAHRHFPMTDLWRPGLAVVLVLVIVALAAAPLARRIARPVERLTEGARRLGRGELAYRVPEDPPRGLVRRRRRHPSELAELTRAFNDMAGRVERLVAGQKELLANVSHELRSPLARIRVALALLPQEGETERRLREVETDLAELDRLIDEVLTAARLDATSVPPQRSPVDVGRLLAELAERAGQDPATAGTTVRVASGPAPALVADATLLRRALWNLVENAAKYGAPPVTLAAGRVGDRVALSVSDEGEGIPAADRERMLAPFQRLDAARTPSAAGEPPRGFGLGLTIARRVAEVHGGTITVAPAAVVEGRERGCRVTLLLPAEP
jgi:signal transduction histidine kinase